MKRRWYKGTGYPFFLTNTIIGWKPIFVSDPYLNTVLDTFQFFRREKGVRLFSYVIMPTHLHYVIDLERSNLNLSEFQRDFKKWIAREVHRLLRYEEKDGQYPRTRIFQFAELDQRETPQELMRFFLDQGREVGQRFRLWMTDEHPVVLTTRKFFYQKVRYIHNNPVKVGLVREAADYPYSSARNYELDDHSVIRIDSDLLE
jgi:putative transposase